MQEILNKQIQDAMKLLIQALNESPHSYSLRLFRYEGETGYRADIHVTNFNMEMDNG